MEWNWKMLAATAIALIAVQSVTCKPVDRRQPQTPPPPNTDGDDEDKGNESNGLEYERYLQQVVEALEKDEEFSKKLANANTSDIKSGAIAMHLDLVARNIRTKLDEIKRMEVQRLQQLARLKSRVSAGERVNRMEIPGHLDLRNPHSFEIKDLENLIFKATKDLEAVDEQRRKDFKEYEMEKEYEYQHKLKELPEEEQQKVKEQHEKLQQKHRDHEKIQHPGSKDQFEDVWEKEDKMVDQDFDPKTFFMMHDINGDMFWDLEEVEAVLQREVGKMYDSRNSPEEDDPVERGEELNRMREHVFTEIDQDKDGMISIDEFLHYTGKHGENKKFEENDGWDTVDEKPQFTDEEYQDYIRKHHAQPGVVPPPVDETVHFEPEEELAHQQHHQERGQQEMPEAVHQEHEPVHQEVVGQQDWGQRAAGQGMAEQPAAHQGQAQQAHPQPPPVQAMDQGQPVQNQGQTGDHQPHQGQGQPDQGQAGQNQPPPAA